MLFSAVMLKARGVLAPSLFLWVLSLCACSQNSSQFVAVHGQTMGTFYNVTVVAPKNKLPTSTELKSWADAEFERINDSMSTYRPDSELSKINRDTDAQWHDVSIDLLQVLLVSEQVSQMSNGAFDITVAPLVNLWGFGPDKHEDAVPKDAEISALMANIGYKKVVLDPDNQRVQRPVGVTMDLSAVAKGYAADAFANILSSKGYQDFLVEVGGELVLKGVSPRGDNWSIGVETPSYGVLNPGPKTTQVVELSNHGMATSGDYRNYYEIDGVRYSHTIDPRTGRPITHKLASVSVIAANCALADAWATALNVLGPDKGLEVAQQHKIAAYFIVSTGAEFKTEITPEFSQYLK